MTIKSFFSPQEQKQILSMRDAGCSLKKISTTMRRSRPNITLFLNSPEEYRKLKDRRDAAEQNGSRSGASKKIEKLGKPKKTPKTPPKAKDQSKFSKTSLAGSTPATNGAKITARNLAEFNKVILEHRCVIKFYTKLGERSSSIYASMKKVYSPLHPPLPAVQYWAAQFRKGRQTILNEKRTVRKLTKVKNNKSPTNKKAKANRIKKDATKKSKKPKLVKSVSKVVPDGLIVEVAPEKSSKDEEPTKKPVAKKVLESTKPFTIKLPGMDRLSKTLR